MIGRESDQPIVLGDGRADHRGKGLTEVRSWQRKHCPARRAGITMPTSLQAIARKAQESKPHRFVNLYGLIDEQHLRISWLFIRQNAAYGVDQVSAKDYE